ncbi:biotin/lipoyl-containing protein [Micromonospora sp. NPDC049101]|uniref:acetyl-CoA carboxylase biotin carboxyl carrier protein n=1 Tax=Micromonospora sp. NPDC049101 TaxID=3155032 RepID=UPI0033F4E3AC
MSRDEAAPLAALRSAAQRIAGDVRGPLRRIRLTDGAATLEMVWADGDHVGEVAGAVAGHPVAAREVSEQAEPPAGTVLVPAPLAGTFYRAPEPSAAPFVLAGDMVGRRTQVGIIEAMKLMIEVLADAEGSVVDVLVGDGELVQHGQPLMVLRVPVGAERG